MSYTTDKLSAIKVRSVTRPGMNGDDAGLWLQVSKSGTKSWIFRYDVCGRRREIGLGSCHTVDLAPARDKRAVRMQAWADYCGGVEQWGSCRHWQCGD